MKTTRRTKKLRSAGFTMLELLIVMVMIAIVAAMAAPSFDSSISRNNVQSMRDSLFNTMQYARSEAVKRKLPVGVCVSANQTSCANNNDWHSGWIVFVDDNGNGTQDSVDEIAIQAHYGEGKLSTPLVNRSVVVFDRLGRSNNALTNIYFVDPKHPATPNRRGIEISATGTVKLRHG